MSYSTLYNKLKKHSEMLPQSQALVDPLVDNLGWDETGRNHVLVCNIGEGRLSSDGVT